MKKIVFLSAVAIASLCFTAASEAQTVSVQFPGYYSQPYGTLNGGYSNPVAGYNAGADPVQYWNVANNSTGGGDGVPNGAITQANLIGLTGALGMRDSTGASSDVTFRLTNANDNRGTTGGAGFPNHDTSVGYNQFVPNDNLSVFLQGGVEASTNAAKPITMSIGGLDPTLSYNLTAYVGTLSYFGSKAASVSLGNTTYYLTTDNGSLTGLTGSSSTSALNAPIADYVEFTDILGADLMSDLLEVHGAGNGLSGFQISEAVATPEPSTIWMLAIGGLGFAIMARRRHLAAQAQS